jgi:uncharacterized protein YceK
MKVRIILILVSLGFCSGCGSFYGRMLGHPTSVYSGVRADTSLAFEGTPRHPLFIIDYPFSAIADTLLLPVDLWPEPSPREPLKSWTFKPFPGWELPPYGHNTNHLDQAIIDDYEGFIKEKHLNLFGAVTGFYVDGTGQHAVQFTAFPPGENATWQYVLIYDKENKRVKTIRCNYRRYMC